MEILRRINASIPKELLRSVTYKERDTSTSDMIKVAMENKHLAPSQRERLERLHEDVSSKEKTVEKVNQRTTKEINEYLDAKIASEMRSGRLKPMEQDSFTRDMESRTKPL